MNLHNEPGFKLVHGGKPPANEPDLPHPDAPIDLGCGLFHPLSQRLDVALANGSLGAGAPVYTTQEIALEISRAIHGRPIREVFATDFIEARRALIESGALYCLASSRRYVGFMALWQAITSDAETGANWRELASFDSRCSGIAAAFSGQHVSAKGGSRGGDKKFHLWSVPKERRRCGLHLSSANKQPTTIKATTIPVEILRDAQILVLSTSARRETAAA